VIIAVQVLHGICYAFFFATVYILVDAYFPNDVRASAQGLFNLMILGLGALAANSLCPWLKEIVFTDPATRVTNYQGLFLIPCFVALIAAVSLAVFFRPPKRPGVEAEGTTGSSGE
jgi:MFS family permease